MSHLRNSIEETKEAIARTQELLQSHPAPSIEATLRSFQKRLARLEAELAPLASTPISSSESVTAIPESNCIPPNQL